MQEVSDLPVSQMRKLLDDRRQKFRISDVQGKRKKGSGNAER
jgi:hypothetical protein